MVDEDQLDEETERRREILNRRPSFKKILNDLAPPDTMENIEEEGNGGGPAGGDSGVLQANSIQIAAHGDGSGGGLQTVTMSNSAGVNSNVATSGATVGGTLVQYAAHTPDGQQFFIPASGVQAYQLAAAAAAGGAGGGGLGSGGGGVVMSASGGGMGSSHGVSEEASRKRELRLLKNRDAAKECRRKKKEYIKCLENRVAVLENQNRTLMEELKALKDLYCGAKE